METYIIDTVGRSHFWVPDQLRGPQEEGEKVVVIETPHSMTACRFQHVLNLNCSHESDVLVEDLPDQVFKFGGQAEAQFEEAPAEEHEGHLMACSVINPHIGTPGLVDVPAELGLSTLDFVREESSDEGFGFSRGLSVPILEGPVPEPHGLFDGGSFLQKLVQLLEIRLEDPKLLAPDCGADGLAPYGLTHRRCTSCSLWRNYKYSLWVFVFSNSSTRGNEVMYFLGSSKVTCSQLSL